MSPVEAAIEQVYAAFADQPRPRTIDGCPCCIDGEELGTLHRTPLRELSGRELSSYAFSALNTVGSPGDYLYYLPRILEQTATGTSFVDTEITGQKLGRVDVPGWPMQRREAVHALFDAVVRDAIANHAGWVLDAWLFAAAQAGFALDPWLGAIRSQPTTLIALYELNSESVPKGRLGNAFWDRDRPGHDALLAWFQHPDTLAAVDDAYAQKYGDV